MTCESESLLILAILGHFVGDYLFQPVWMALGKSVRSWKGFGICLIHCVAYTVAVVLVTTTVMNPWMWGMVFLSHFPIDRWGLGQKWLDLIGGRNVMKDWDAALDHIRVKNGPCLLIPEDLHIPSVITAFAAIVYTVTDNTLHILLMFLGILLLRQHGLV